MRTTTRRILLIAVLGLIIAPVATYHVARQQLPSRIRVPVRAGDLSFSSLHFGRHVGIQIHFQASASASAELKELMTRITPVWSLIPVEKHNAEWLVDPYTGSGIYWDDYALTR